MKICFKIDSIKKFELSPLTISCISKSFQIFRCDYQWTQFLPDCQCLWSSLWSFSSSRFPSPHIDGRWWSTSNRIKPLSLVKWTNLEGVLFNSAGGSTFPGVGWEMGWEIGWEMGPMKVTWPSIYLLTGGAPPGANMWGFSFRFAAISVALVLQKLVDLCADLVGRSLTMILSILLLVASSLLLLNVQ